MPPAPLVQLFPWFAGAALGLATFVGAVALRRAPEAEGETDSHHGGAFGVLTQPLAQMLPDILPRKAHRDLLRSGFYRPTAYDSYLALRNSMVLGVVLATACWLVAIDTKSPLFNTVLLVGFVSALVAYSLPRIYLISRGDRRAEQIEVGLPDGLDMMVLCLTGGLPLQTSLDRTTDEIQPAHPALADELQIVRRQAAAGSLEFALDRFAKRLDIDVVTNLTEMVNHAQRMGTPIGAVLRDAADGMRHTRMQRAKQRANKLSLKMLFPVVLCLMPATYVVVLAPPLIQLKNFRDKSHEAGGILSRDNIKQRTAAPSARQPATTPDGKKR